MQVFRDSEGRDIEIVINVATVKRVKAALSIDLTDPASLVGDSKLPLLSCLEGADVFVMVDVLFECCRASVEKHSLDEMAFAASLGGPVVGAAQQKLMEEWESFFLGFGRLEAVKAIQTSRKIVTKRMAKQQQLVEEAGASLEAQIDRLSLSAIAGPEFSASTQADSLPVS